MNKPEFKSKSTTKYVWYAFGSLCGKPAKWHRSCWDAETEAEAKAYRKNIHAVDIFENPNILVKETTTQEII